MRPLALRLRESLPAYTEAAPLYPGVQEIKMNLYRRILMLSLALAVAASGVCFSQAAPKKKDIYSEKADAHSEIKEALKKAAAEHKRVIVVFGANWCYDCHVLDAAFH